LRFPSGLVRSKELLSYLIRDCYSRDLACVLFGGGAWKVKARDGFIGWSAQQRQQRLSLIVNNSRFLILSHMRVPHLASHILGLILRRLRRDWQSKYQIVPCLAETFVERDRFSGICYRAANARSCPARRPPAGCPFPQTRTEARPYTKATRTQTRTPGACD
jgi:hypothetical protein